MSEDKRTKVDHDNPPFSRLFVVCSKNHSEDDIKDAFGLYGKLQDVWVVKDRHTQDNKGIAYIKFEKASEAHAAMEKLHGETIGGDSKALKVLLADNKGQNRSVSGETKPRQRIFILVPKTMESSEIEDEFSKYGAVDHIQVLTDKSTGESKGCAYVKYMKPSSAFVALEDCDSKYKAVIAEPKVPRDSRTYESRDSTRFSSSDSSHTRNRSSGARSYNSYNTSHQEQQNTVPQTISYTDMTDPGAMQRLYIVCHTSLLEEQLYSLFDLIPGLESFELKTYRGSSESRGFAYASYQTVEFACYAKRKLDGLEYPPGHKLIVKYAEERPGRGEERAGHRERQGSSSMDSMADPVTINRNTPGFAAGSGPQPPSRECLPSRDCPYSDMPLPNPLPLAAPGTPCRGKLFIVGTPSIPEEKVLRNVFCRFAGLIDIKLIPGTSYGYIRFGMKESSEAASMVLNNQKIAGSVIKLSQQDETPGGENKRQRSTYENAGNPW